MYKQCGSEHPCLDLLGNRVFNLTRKYEILLQCRFVKRYEFPPFTPSPTFAIIQLSNFHQSDGCNMLSECSCWVFYLKFFTWEYFQMYRKVGKIVQRTFRYPLPRFTNCYYFASFYFSFSIYIFFSESLQIKLCEVCALIPKYFNAYVLRIRTSLILSKYNDPL